jgi:hypothetical protein
MCFDHKKNLKKIRIKLYNTLTGPPNVVTGSETGTVTARDGSRISAAEMKYMRRTAGYTGTGYKTNTQIAKQLKKLQFWTNYWNTRETGYNM